MSKEWFDWYCNEASKEKDWARYRDRYLCPCCYMPTLDERAGYSICIICFWEDDGQDNDDAEVIRGGPNSDYSLYEARSNFEKNKTMYRESDVRPYEGQKKIEEKRMDVYNAFAQAMRSGDDCDWNAALKEEKNFRNKD